MHEALFAPSPHLWPRDVLDETLFADPEVAYAAFRAHATPYQPLLYCPRYVESYRRNVRVRRSTADVTPGHVSGLRVCPDGAYHVLMEHDAGGKLWQPIFTTGPREQEGVYLGARFAHGHTVVLGLRLGMTAYSCCLNPAVTRVTIVEPDEEWIRIFTAVTHGSALSDPCIREKWQMLTQDALTVNSAQLGTVDHLLVNIWDGLTPETVVPYIQQVVRRLRPQSLYFWGQEQVILNWHLHCYTEAPWVSPAQLRDYVETTQLPLTIALHDDYPRFLQRVHYCLRLAQDRGQRRIRRVRDMAYGSV